MPGEGKSTIAANLALSNAIAGRRTVLIDVDLRNSSVARTFRLTAADRDPSNPPHAGIEYITKPFQELPFGVVSVGIPGQPRPDMLDSPRFRSFIRDVARQFDMVVLDGPPVLMGSDALSLSDVADATLLVISASDTPVSVLNETMKLLRTARSPLAGLVLNKTDPKQRRRYYGYAAG